MAEIIFILVNVARGENTGATARAMKTMGFESLRLVNPKCNHLGSKSIYTAHASKDILEKAWIYQSYEEAIRDIDLVIGTTAKKRSVHEDYHWVEDLPGIIHDKGDTVNTVGIVFGCEESGLTNHQLSLCHLVSSIPMKNKYPSLNLGQAVMVYSTYLGKLTLNNKRKSIKEIGKSELPVIRDKAHQILLDINIDPGGIIYPRIMERLMLLEKDDINLFHTFCKFYMDKYHGKSK